MQLPYRPPPLAREAPTPARMPDAPRPSTDPTVPTVLRAPADDPGVVPPAPEPIDIFTLTPLAALKLLTGAVEALVRENENNGVPPDQAYGMPATPNSQAAPEADQHGTEAATSAAGGCEQHGDNTLHPPPDSGASSPSSQHHADVPPPHKTPIGSPETETHHTTDDDAPAKPDSPRATEQLGSATAAAATPGTTPHVPEPPPDTAMHFQEAALARRFVSKAVPPIPLHAYLRRLHTYCPLSVAAYLAAGLYIRRLAFPSSSSSASHANGHAHSAEDEPPPTAMAAVALVVTPRAAHRLALAALRVATKALEDRGYAHARVAKVGGVAERELGRLEVALCFLTEFRLVVDAGALAAAAEWMRGIGGAGEGAGEG